MAMDQGMCEGAYAAPHTLQPSQDLSSFRGYPCLSAWAMYSSLNLFPGNIHAIMAWTAQKKLIPRQTSGTQHFHPNSQNFARLQAGKAAFPAHALCEQRGLLCC